MSTAVAHRRALYGHNRNAAWQAYLEGELPEGYRRVEYIESTGTQWIDTGVGFSPTDELTLKVTFRSYSNTKYVIAPSPWNNDSNMFSLLGRRGGKLSYYFGKLAGVYQTETSISTGQIYHVSYKNRLFSCGDLLGDVSTAVFGSDTGNLRLFYGLYASTPCRVYSYIHVKNGTQFRHLVPCVRVSDGKPGMFDLCGSLCSLTNSPFYVNSDTGVDFMWKEFDGPGTNEVWYWAAEQVTLGSDDGIIGHSFNNGKGVVSSSQTLSSLPNNLFAGTGITSVRMPNGVLGISTNTFKDCVELELEELPDSLTAIYGSSFSGCLKLTLSKLPPNVTSIATGTFHNCTGLTSIVLHHGFTNINTNGFRDCTKLASVEFSDTLSSIGSYAFSGCSSLSALYFPASVDIIKTRCFSGCSSLASVVFGGTPTSIYSDVFYSCKNLTDIYVPWSEGEVANAPWGATNATIHYNHTAS